MPVGAKSPCRQSGCRALVSRPGYCDVHRGVVYHIQKQNVSVDYKERNRFYQRAAWKKVRADHLEIEPYCRSCYAAGWTTLATIVDHIVSIEAGGDEYDHGNLQSLCVKHHNSKTRIETNRKQCG